MDQELIQQTRRLAQDPGLGEMQRRSLLDALPREEQDWVGVEIRPVAPNPPPRADVPYAPPLPKL